MIDASTATDERRTAERAAPGAQEAAFDCLRWLALCAARLAELEPMAAPESICRAANALWACETLRRMPPRAAADLMFPQAAERLLAALSKDEP